MIVTSNSTRQSICDLKSGEEVLTLQQEMRLFLEICFAFYLNNQFEKGWSNNRNVLKHRTNKRDI